MTNVELYLIIMAIAVIAYFIFHIIFMCSLIAELRGVKEEIRRFHEKQSYLQGADYLENEYKLNNFMNSNK